MLNSNEAQYYFTIGSAEAFERSLEQAQAAMGVSPEHYIPVTYIHETSLGYAPCVGSSFMDTGGLLSCR